jgi:ubiquinone/menaquinone biosynthesis C-methylase UbiE
MTKSYWDKAHIEKYSKSDWANKPSLFLQYALQYFPKSGSVLDIGTGQGQDAIHLQFLGYQVTAIDYSDVALKNAKKKTNGVTFLKVDTAKGLPFNDESFDVAYSHMALHYFDMKTTKKVFEDIHRILKPGGILAIITNTVDDPERHSRDYTKIEDNFYKTDRLVKRYFSIEDMKNVTIGLFESLVLDNKGETYKDEIKSLIRFIGKKISLEL